MAIRVFTCRHCGHQIRLGASRCGQCEAAAPAVNITLVHIMFFMFAALLAIIGTALLVR